jgi:hypothetical protein
MASLRDWKSIFYSLFIINSFKSLLRTYTMPDFVGRSIIESRAFIEFVCAVTPDRITVGLAELFMMREGGEARKHLDHYLAGTGANLYVDLGRVFRQDSRVKNKVYTIIRGELSAHRTSGVIPIPQRDYSNRDWQFAIGGMPVRWHVNPNGTIRCFFENLYRWHPELARVTQCVHQAAVALQVRIGAKDYLMYGETLVSTRDL